MQGDDAALNCRVCGYRNVEPPWGEDGRTPEYDFCPCCGAEHGYQDSTATGARVFREKWLLKGAPWDEAAAKPPDWDLEVQLRGVPADFR